MRGSSPYGDTSARGARNTSRSIDSGYGGTSNRGKMKKSASTKSDMRTNSNINIFRQSKAKEFESYKNLPRFTHANMAVIHPATKTASLRPSVSVPEIKVEADTVKI